MNNAERKHLLIYELGKSLRRRSEQAETFTLTCTVGIYFLVGIKHFIKTLDNKFCV